jgi:hypothetical protein
MARGITIRRVITIMLGAMNWKNVLRGISGFSFSHHIVLHIVDVREEEG